MGCKQSKDKKEEATTSGENAAAAEEAPAAEGESEPKLIVVFGATGAQGGSVARALKADSDHYTVRALTRNPDSEKAKALAEEGFDVVQADSEDPESLKKAIEGAYGVYAVTNYWEVSDIDKEITQGKNMIDAAKEAGVKHFIYSGLEGVEKAIGKICGQFDAKAAVEDYMKEQEITFTSVRLAFYYENLLAMMKPTKGEDGSFTLGIPMGDVPLAMLSVKEIGECVHQIFNNLEEYKGKFVGLSGDSMKIEDYAAVLSKALEPKKFDDAKMTTEAFAGLGFFGAEQLAAMFEFYQKGNPIRDVELTKKLNPDMPNFDQWVSNNKDALDEVTN